MHLKFVCCQQIVCCFSVKIWVASLHYVCSFVKLYMELVYPSLIIDLCAVVVLHHQNSIGYSTSIFRNHNLESFSILA